MSLVECFNICGKKAPTRDPFWHYNCPDADSGSALKLALGDAKWSGTVMAGHDPTKIVSTQVADMYVVDLVLIAEKK